jgi:hypothetical protein
MCKISDVGYHVKEFTIDQQQQTQAGTVDFELVQKKIPQTSSVANDDILLFLLLVLDQYS